MGRIIDDLLLLARLDQHRPLESEVVDIAALCHDAVRDARASAPQRTITLLDSEAIEVVGDEHRLRQVLANIMANALMHTPTSSNIDVVLHVGEQSVSVSIADSGPGMDAATAARAFERFFRADASRTRSTGGSGLGLSIAREIVEAHHGTIDIRSDPIHGTAVTITIPRHQDGTTAHRRDVAP
jgi:two-component system, OmpR family, sensor kinase